jgi:hypothetical protein
VLDVIFYCFLRLNVCVDAGVGVGVAVSPATSHRRPCPHNPPFVPSVPVKKLLLKRPPHTTLTARPRFYFSSYFFILQHSCELGRTHTCHRSDEFKYCVIVLMGERLVGPTSVGHTPFISLVKRTQTPERYGSSSSMAFAPQHHVGLTDCSYLCVLSAAANVCWWRLSFPAQAAVVR